MYLLECSKGWDCSEELNELIHIDVLFYRDDGRKRGRLISDRS